MKNHIHKILENHNIKPNSALIKDLIDITAGNNKDLSELHEKYSILYNNSHLSYQSLDINGNIIEVNNTWLNSLAYQQEDVIGKWFGDFLHPDYVNTFKERFEQFKKDGSVEDVLFQMRKKNKEYILVSFKGCILHNPNGEFKCTYCSFVDITDETLTLEKLQESESNYKRLLENSPAITYINNLNKGALYWSSKIKDVLGFDPNNIIVDTTQWTKSIHPEDIPKIDKILNNIEIGKTYELEYRIYDVNKNLHWFYDRVFSVYNKNGDIILEGIISDITEKKNIEIELKESEEKFRAITNSAQDAIVLINEKGNVIFWNKAAEKTFQYKEHEVIGKNLHTIIAPAKYREKHNIAFSKFIKSGEGDAINKIVELSALRKDGSEFPIDLSLSALKYNNEWHSIGIVRDITERKNKEKELKDSEDKYLSLFASMNEGVVLHEMIYDLNNKAIDYRILEINQAFENHTDIKAENAENQLASEFYGTNPAPYFDIYSKVAETRESTEFETYFPPLNKHFSISVFSPKKGMFATVFNDITERKNYEEKLKDLLILADKKQEELNEINATKDRFFSIIAHDLRGPVNNLVGFSDLLERNHLVYDKDKLAHIINLMNTSAKKTYSLLENLLLWSKSQRDKISFTPQTYICKELVEEVLDEMQHLAYAKGINIISNDGKGHPVLVDKDMFKTVYRNLISNAIKFTNKGGSITIGCGKLINNQVEFFVKDNGVGIAPDILTKLFKLDHNITTEGTNKEKGTGLGLILCKEFIEKHKGEIRVESEVGKGTAFKFTFPLSNI
jgi:PAS domain S-box-containing protein